MLIMKESTQKKLWLFAGVVFLILSLLYFIDKNNLVAIIDFCIAVVSFSLVFLLSRKSKNQE